MHFCVFDKMLQKYLSFLNLNQLSPAKMTDIFGATQQTFWPFLFCQSNVLLSRSSLIFNSLPTVYTAWTESCLSKLFLILTRAKENWTLITMILAAEIETEQLCEKWRLICHRRHLMASQTLILPHLRIACQPTVVVTSL